MTSASDQDLSSVSTEEESSEENRHQQSSRLLNIPRPPTLKTELQEHFMPHLGRLQAKIRSFQFFMQGSSAPVSDTDIKIKSKFATEENYWSEATSESDSTDQSESEVDLKDTLEPDIEKKVQFESDHKEDSEPGCHDASDFDSSSVKESESTSESLTTRTQKCIHASGRVKRYVKRGKRVQKTEKKSSSSPESTASESYCYQLPEELTPEILLKRNGNLWIAWKHTKLCMREFMLKSDTFSRVCIDIDRYPSPMMISEFIKYLDILVRTIKEFIPLSHEKLRKCKEFQLIRRKYDFWFEKILENALEVKEILSDILERVIEE